MTTSPPSTAGLDDDTIEALRDFGGFLFGNVIAAALGKCPKCRSRLIAGQWLRWCPKRSCQATIEVKS